MTIKNLTDQVVPRFPRIGKLRKGGEKTDKGMGDDLDHFRFVGVSSQIQSAFAKAYPGQPREISIFIPHDTVAQAFPTHCEVWAGTGLLHRCDGETMSVWREGPRYVRGAKPCIGGHKDNDPHRDAVGRLEFVIPELLVAGFVGYVQLETHSLHDIMNISRVLGAVYKSQGTLAGVEFKLRRVKESISSPGWGARKAERSRVDKWLVRLEPTPEWVRSVLARERSQALNLPAPKMNVDPATGEIIEPPMLTTGPAPAPAEPAPVAAGEVVDPLTEGIYTNTSSLKPETVRSWTAKVKEAMAAGLVQDFTLTPADNVGTHLRDRVQVLNAAIAKKRQLVPQ